MVDAHLDRLMNSGASCLSEAYRRRSSGSVGLEAIEDSGGTQPEAVCVVSVVLLCYWLSATPLARDLVSNKPPGNRSTRTFRQPPPYRLLTCNSIEVANL